MVLPSENEPPQDVGRVTLREVAARAGVSVATASLVLRESPLVADATRTRVVAAMRELRYVYHRGAASLRSRASGAVGLIVPDITNPFFAEFTVGVESHLDGARRTVLLGNTAETLDKQERLLDTMREQRADGVLLCPTVGTTPETLAQLRRWRLPCVLVVRYLPGIEIDYVGAENTRGAGRAVNHLIALGHRRVAFIGGAATSSARRDRLRGYRAALEQHGIAPDPALSMTGPPTRDGGHRAVLELLARPDPPTAALCYNDVVAFGVMLGVGGTGRGVGRDFGVIGFDDIAEAALWRPALTTVALAQERLGAVAADLLLERITRPDDAPKQIVLPARLVVRESCGAGMDG